MTELARLSLAVDSRQVNKANRSLRNLEGQGKKTERATDGLTRAVKRLAGPIALGLVIRQFTQMVKTTSAAIDSQAKFADMIGVSTEAMAGLQLAAELTGVETNKLNMGLQRMTRRVAEAAQGTGEAQGALKELGLSAQALNALSPDEQFNRIAEAMEGVNSQTDRVRLAFKLFDSEGVALLNTLELGRDGLNQVQQEAEDLGIALSRVDAANVERMNDAFTRLGRVSTGIKQQITVGISQPMAAAVQEIVQASMEMGGFGETASSVSDVTTAGIGAIGDGFQRLSALILASRSAINFLEAGFQDFAAGIGKFGVFGLAFRAAGVDSQELRESARQSLEDAQRQHRELVDRAGEEPFSVRLERRMRLNQLDVLDTGRQDPFQALSDSAEMATEAVASEFDKLNARLNEQIALYGDTGEAARIRYQVENDLIEGLTRSQGELLIQQAEQLDGMRRASEFADEVDRVLERSLPAVQRQIRSIREDMLLLNLAYEEGQISAEQFATATQTLEARMAGLKDNTEKATEEMSVFAKRAAENMQDAFADFLFDPFQSGLDGMAQGFIDAMRRMVAEAAAADLAAAIGLPGSGSGGNLSSMFSAVAGMFGGGGGGTDVSSLLVDNTPRISSFDGGGYTGNGPRSGGLDGMGGELGIFHPRETVTDHTKGQKPPSDQSRNTTIINVAPAPNRQQGFDTANQISQEMTRKMGRAQVRFGSSR